MNDWQEWASDLIDVAASQVAGGFRGIVEPGDVRNELWCWALEHPDKLQELYEEDDHKSATFYLSTEARKYCRREKAARAGYSVDDEQYYTLPVLRELMHDVFDHEGWTLQSKQVDSQPKAKADPRMSGERMVMLADVAQALQQLPERHYNVLVWVFKYSADNAALADELDCTEEAAQKRTERALKALQRALGGASPFKEYTGSRKIRSNASAMADTQRSLNG